VAALDLDGAALDAAVAAVSARGGDVLGVKSDVTSATDVQSAAERVLARWGRVDVLVNNAGGFATMRALEDTSEAEWDAILRSNLTSAFLVSKAVLPVMKRQRAGRIVNLASVVARGGAVRVPAHYAGGRRPASSP
jgi:3-oxoacyl-[acyl-carrier protein] reductase